MSRKAQMQANIDLAVRCLGKSPDSSQKTAREIAERELQKPVAKSTFEHWVKMARLDGLLDEFDKPKEKPDLIHDDLPTENVPIEDILAFKRNDYTRRAEAHAAKQWFKIQVPMNEPIAINWFGDPHLDDDGCNHPLLERHIQICNEPGVYAANIGDSHNNWQGRLLKLYANQELSRTSAYRLVRWFYDECGLKWAVFLLGNHDMYGDGIDVLRQMAWGSLVMHEWQARFRLAFPNGRECRVWAAHHFKGTSLYSNLHGARRAAIWSGHTAHLYVNGHHHDWGLEENEDPYNNQHYWLARARGYKHIDSYGEQLQYFPQKYGSSIFQVINPHATTETGFHRCFPDPEEGVEWLRFLRAKK